MSFHREGVDKDGPSTSLSPLGQAVVSLWANSTSEERRLGWCVSSAPASRICYRLGTGFIWRSSEQAGQREQYGPGIIEAGQMQCLQGTRSRARVFRWQGSKPQAGCPRNGVQAEGPLRRHPPAGAFDGAVGTPVPVPLFSSRSRSLEFASQLRSEALYRSSHTRLSRPAVSDLQFWRDLPKHLHHRPIWPSHPSPTTTIHTDSSLSAFSATLGQGPLEAGARALQK
jgi:hypothetical protein